ncbi:Quinonprotein alcohol dehydrogenase-like superfamily [Pseudocohnilembus persalinus]|uniref:Quinonprotein alcohol dehydrogenase-like superfamily n=1 Tax=Pseudocohnilembus persalinus TaxID=266149 RepID=A0A0V0QHY9_PSEPJ|nr:Quinonprotein alcohol dehydrogenase-like superfamily [Pseudocohnilembus persalinus]|eukprot:KRX01810.1 Quinonprotein alcohol dehydrogenase-like superfamily [Pseudocohnilembus persalinus]
MGKNIIKCKIHQDMEIGQICMAQNCENRLACNLCYQSHNQSHQKEFLLLVHVIDQSKKVTILDQVVQKLEKEKEEKKEKLNAKKGEVKEKLRFQYQAIQEVVKNSLEKREQKNLELIETYFQKEEEQVEGIQSQILELQQEIKRKLEVGKMKKLEEKIGDSIRVFNEIQQGKMKEINEELEMFNLILGKKGNKVVKNVDLNQFQKKIELMLDNFNLVYLKDLGQIKIDEKNLKDIQYVETLDVFNEDWITSICALENNINCLVSASNDKSVNLVNLATKQPQLTITNHTDSVNKVISISDNIVASACSDSYIRVWDVSDGSVVDFLQGHTGAVLTMAKVNKNQILSGGADKVVFMWDLKKKSVIHQFRGNQSVIMCVLFIDEGIIATGNQQGQILIFQIKENEVIIQEEMYKFQAHSRAVKDMILLDSENDLIVSASLDGSIKVWNWSTQENIRVYEEHTSAVNCLLYINSSSGSWDTSIKVWDVNNKKNKSIFSLEIEGNYIECMAYLNDGKTIITGGSDKHIRVFQVPISVNNNFSSLLQLSTNDFQEIVQEQQKFQEMQNSQCELCNIF